MLAEFPRLKDIEISLEKLLDGGKLAVGGMHFAPDGQYPHEILLRLGGVHELLNLKKERATAFERYARLLGVPVSEITPEIYNVFIFLHEMGHACTADRYLSKGELRGRQLQIYLEKSAWGWALLVFKDLKRRGIDLEEQWATEK